MVLPPEADLVVARVAGSAAVEDVEVHLLVFPFSPCGRCGFDSPVFSFFFVFSLFFLSSCPVSILGQSCLSLSPLLSFPP